MPQGTLYTLGYLIPGASDLIHTMLIQAPTLLLVDSRYNPTSRLAQWRQGALMRSFRTSYRHLQALGNSLYRTPGQITLLRPEEGLTQVLSWLSCGRSVILLCACHQRETCHRTLVATLLQERVPDLIVVPLPLSGNTARPNR